MCQFRSLLLHLCLAAPNAVGFHSLPKQAFLGSTAPLKHCVVCILLALSRRNCWWTRSAAVGFAETAFCACSCTQKLPLVAHLSARTVLSGQIWMGSEAQKLHRAVHIFNSGSVIVEHQAQLPIELRRAQYVSCGYTVSSTRTRKNSRSHLATTVVCPLYAFGWESSYGANKRRKKNVFITGSLGPNHSTAKSSFRTLSL